MAVQNIDPLGDLVLKETIEQRIGQIDQQRLYNFNPSDDEVADFIKKIANVFVDFSEKFATQDLNLLNERIPELRQSSERLAERFEKWLAKRIELINVLKSSAQELDNRFTIITTSRLIGSVLDLVYNIDSVCEHAISHAITNQAFSLSRVLGVASLIFFKCLPHFAYMGLVSAFAEALFGKITMHDISKVNEEDTKLFDKVDEWIQETGELESSIEQEFPTGFRLDVIIAKKIEEILSDYEENAKIFTTTVLSNVRKCPNTVNQICEIIKFAQTDAAVEWYDRSVRGVYSVGMEISRLEYRNNLIQLSLAAPEIPLEIVKLAPEIQVVQKDSKVAADAIISVKLKLIPHFVLGALNCFYIYTSYRVLRSGARHQHSDLLRDMAEKAAAHMKKMNSFVGHCTRSRAVFPKVGYSYPQGYNESLMGVQPEEKLIPGKSS